MKCYKTNFFMKQKTKNFLKLFVLAVILVLGSCEVEQDLVTENSRQDKVLIMHKKFDELIKQTAFKTAFNKIFKPKISNFNSRNSTNRTVMENQYNFTIADYPANMITLDSITTYTILITRQNPQPNVFENLILTIKENTQPEAFIIKYESTSPLNSNILYNPLTFVGTRTLIPITYNASPVSSKITIDCKTIMEWFCPNHTKWEPGCTGYGTSTDVCTISGGGGSSGSGGSAGGSSGGIINQTNSAPIVPCTRDCPDVSQDPCLKLAKLSADTNFKEG